MSEEDPCVGAGKITRDNGRRVTTTTARVAPVAVGPGLVVAGPPAIVVAGFPTAASNTTAIISNFPPMRRCGRGRSFRENTLGAIGVGSGMASECRAAMS